MKGQNIVASSQVQCFESWLRRLAHAHFSNAHVSLCFAFEISVLQATWCNFILRLDLGHLYP